MTIDHNFRTTKWSLVVSAADADADALQELCTAYWPALHRHVQRMGYQNEDARDLTQDFFTRLLEKKLLNLADPDRGRFRTFLLTALNRFVISQWHRREAAKRGGGRKRFSINPPESEQSRFEPRNESTPESEFHRDWAIRLIENTLQRLETSYETTEAGELFDALLPCIVRDSNSPSYADVATRMGSTEAAVKMAATRIRSGFVK